MSDPQQISVALSAHTDVGVVRTNNEDNFLILALAPAAPYEADAMRPPEEEMCLLEVGCDGAVLAVSDGMGGALAGEVASQMAVRGVAQLMRRYHERADLSALPIHARLRMAIETTNASIHQQSQRRQEFAGMGATLTAATLEPGVLHLAQVGDSRAYLIRGGRIKQVTKDQSLVEHLLESGYLTEEQAARHAYRNVILQALGAHPDTEVVVDRIDLCRDDLLMLCSDGLSNKVTSEEMLEVVQGGASLAATGRNLIALAKERGGEDNITLIIARIDGKELPPPGIEDPRSQRIERGALPAASADPAIMPQEELDALADERTLRPEDTAEDGTPGLGSESMAAGGGAAATPPWFLEGGGHRAVVGMSQEDVRVATILLTILAIIILGAILAGWWYVRTRGNPSPINEIPASEVVRSAVARQASFVHG